MAFERLRKLGLEGRAAAGGPKVPSRWARPARPAIWANSAGLSLRN